MCTRLGEETLADALERRMSVSTALSYLEQLLEGLAHAHERGVIHCDVKPENLILFADGVLRICDFGIAKAVAETLAASGSGTHRLPGAGAGAGAAHPAVRRLRGRARGVAGVLRSRPRVALRMALSARGTGAPEGPSRRDRVAAQEPGRPPAGPLPRRPADARRVPTPQAGEAAARAQAPRGEEARLAGGLARGAPQAVPAAASEPPWTPGTSAADARGR